MIFLNEASTSPTNMTNMDYSTKGVYIAVLNQGNIRAELSYMITEMTHQRKYRLHVCYPAGKPIAQNRNEIVQDFLYKHQEMDYLMMCDSDIIPPANFLDLVEYDKDIIGGICFAYRQGSIIPLLLERKKNFNKLDEEKGEYPYSVMEHLKGDEGLVEVDAIGTGVIIIRRNVLEELEDEQPFCNQYDKKGIKQLGLDLSFCYKAKQKGFKIFAHLDYLSSHWQTVDLKDLYSAVSQSNEIKSQKIKEQEEHYEHH